MSHMILSLAEIANRLFPMINNVIEQYPITIQNVESFKINMETALNLKYALIAYHDDWAESQ